MVMKRKGKRTQKYRFKKRLNRFKKKFRKANNDGKISRKVRVLGFMAEKEPFDRALTLINWFGVADPPSSDDSGARLFIRPLLDEEHKDACARFKYFKITYCKVRYHVSDVVDYNNEGTAKTVGLDECEMASDTKLSNLFNNSGTNIWTTREDYSTRQAKRGATYKKGFKAQKYLKRHHPGLTGWIPTDTTYFIGELFYTGIAQRTIEIADNVVTGKVEVVMYIKYKNFKYSAL